MKSTERGNTGKIARKMHKNQRGGKIFAAFQKIFRALNSIYLLF